MSRLVYRVLFTTFCLLFPWMLRAQLSLADWVAEDASDAVQIRVSADTMEISSPQGLTLWYRPRLTGDYTITYRICMPMCGSAYDRLSDMNCFWAANDPASPDNLFARSEWRKGIFPRYKTLTLFYVGYGGNNNSTTRFRKYFGATETTADAEARPVIHEYTDSAHLLSPAVWYEVQIRVSHDTTTYAINGEELFRLPIVPREGDGHFGLRLLENHVLFTDFRISQPE